MSASPLTPFALLFAQLSQSMSPPPPFPPVVVDVGYNVDAQHTSVERVVFIPRRMRAEFVPFQLPGMVTPYRQACDFDVSMYGNSIDRLLEIHRLLIAGLEVGAGPALGAPPSDDAAPAALRGTTDLAALVYPYSGLVGKSIKVTVPGARDLAFPGTPLASPQAIATAIIQAALTTGPGGLVQEVRARIIKSGAHIFLELLLPTDPIGTVGSTLAIDPAAPNSACAALGFSSGAGNITGTGTPPTRLYRPGYFVGDGSPDIRGGDASAQGWGCIVPVTLYRPLPTFEDLVGVIADTPLQVSATGGTDPPENVVNIA